MTTTHTQSTILANGPVSNPYIDTHCCANDASDRGNCFDCCDFHSHVSSVTLWNEHTFLEMDPRLNQNKGRHCAWVKKIITARIEQWDQR